MEVPARPRPEREPVPRESPYPFSVAAPRPPDAAIARGKSRTTPTAMTRLWNTSVQTAARNPPYAVYATTVDR